MLGGGDGSYFFPSSMDGEHGRGVANNNYTTSAWVYTQLSAKLSPSENGLENDTGFWFSEFTYHISQEPRNCAYMM